MSNILEELMGSMGPELTKQLSSNLGIDANSAAKLIPQVAPLILGGLKRQKDNHGGQQRVDHILNKYGKADVLSDVGGLFSGMMKSNDHADARLGGLLGESGVQATDQITKQLGIDPSVAGKIIPMLAPVVLGFLTQKRDDGKAGSSGIEALLDQDGDGSVLDDVAGFFLGGGAKSGGGGLLGGLLSGLLGGKK